MFRKVIESTAFTTLHANNVFQNIRGVPVNGDISFLSTLRALLANRIGDDQFTFNYWDMDLRSSRISGCTSERLAEYVYDRTVMHAAGLRLVTLGSQDEEVNSRFFEAVKNSFGNSYNDKDWVVINAVTDFFKKTCDVVCVANQKHKESVLVLNSTDMRLVHYVQVAILTALPWYFNPQEGDRVSDLELKLLISLRERNPDNYLDCLREIAGQMNFEGEFIRKSLYDIEGVCERNRIKELESEISSYMNRISDLRDKIGDIMRLVHEKNTEYTALDMKMRSGESAHELYDYFMCNRTLKLDAVNMGTQIVYHVNDYITYYDETIAQTFIDNYNSVVYKYVKDREREAVKRLITAIFIDETIRVRTCAAYRFDINGGYHAIASYDFGEDSRTRIPNPHIYYHSCTGNYETPMYECMMARDYIGYIEQTIASAQSLNFGDGIVINEFFHDLFDGVGGKCIELPDGTLMDINDALKYIMEGNENE